MERQSQVYDVKVELDGEEFSASYFVEHEVIHAMLDGDRISVPVGTGSPKSTVQSLLLGELLNRRRRERQRDSWSKVGQ
jgi:hypothetical protein